MNIMIIFLTILFLLPNNSLAGSGYYEDCYYETRDRISISVSGRALREKEKDIFFYSYTVKSNPQSEQDVYRFRIILPEKSIVIDATAPDGWRGPGWSGGNQQNMVTCARVNCLLRILLAGSHHRGIALSLLEKYLALRLELLLVFLVL